MINREGNNNNKITRFEVGLFVCGLIWMLSILFHQHLSTIINNCLNDNSSILICPIKNYHATHPLSLVLLIICLPLDYLVRTILPYFVNLICTNIELFSQILLVLKVIILSPVLLIIGILSFIYLKN
jgi:hypothetical protein